MTGTAVSFGTLDWAVVGLYFVANTAICVWAALKKEKDTADYFLASRSAGWFLIGSSIFASNIGAEHLIGLAGSGAGSGMAFAHWELHSWLVLMLGWLFAPFYLRANVFTTPEFLERRYTPGTRTLLSGIFLASYILTKASVTIFAGAFAIQTILGYETIHLPLFGEVDFFWFSAAFLVIVTGVFVVAGGMLSVLWTEAMHVPVLLAGSAVLLVVGLHEIGGWDSLLAANPDNLHLWRPLSTTAGHAGLSGIPVRSQRDAVARRVAVLAHHRSLVLVHRPVHRAARVVGARPQAGAPGHDLRGVSQARAGVHLPDPRHDCRGAVQAEVPGLRTHRQQPAGGVPDAGLEPAAHRPARSGARRHVVCTDERTGVAVQLDCHLVHRRLLQAPAPAVFRASTWYSSAAWRRGAVVIIGMIWIPIMQAMSKQLYSYLQLVQSLLAPGIAAVFMAGIFSRRVTPKSGFIGLATGFSIGMLRLLLQALHQSAGIEWPGSSRRSST